MHRQKKKLDNIIKEMNREAKQKNQQKALDSRTKLKEKLSSARRFLEIQKSETHTQTT